MRNFDPSEVQALGLYVLGLQKRPNTDAILGTANLPGVGLVTLFSDCEARDAYNAHVRPGLYAMGDFVTPVEVYEGGDNHEENAVPELWPVEIVWGQRRR